MTNLPDKHYFKPTYLDKSTHSATVNRRGFFLDRNAGFEDSFNNTTNSNTFSTVLPSQSSGNIQMNQTFKIPKLDNLPTRKTISNVRAVSSRPSIKSNMSLTKNQQPKVSLIPRPSFITSRKSLHGSRSAQLNARKELLKQMVFLHEYGLKERREQKKSTPIKTLAGLTPKKTPRSGGYFVLPEFSKKAPKLEDIKTPIRDFVKKEMFSYTTKPTPVFEKQNEKIAFKLNDEHTTNFIIRPKELNMETQNVPNPRVRLSALLKEIKLYNTKVSEIYEKLKVTDNNFENKIRNLPDYRVYNEFCFYKTKKEDLYQKLHKLEIDFTNFAATHTRIGKELESYIKNKQEVLEKQLSIHMGFEEAVISALEGCGENKTEEITKEEKIEEPQPKAESPKLRRSLRLSKMRKNKFEEKSPLSKRLRKLDAKSRGIQKV